MSYYGHSPENFKTDWTSVFGGVGAALRQTMSVLPELQQLDSQITENKFFKEKAYAATQKFLDETDEKKITNIASSMGIQYDPNNPEEARAQLKQMVLDPSKLNDRTSSAEYVKRLAEDFFVPFGSAAKSKAGGGEISWGELFGTLRSGELRGAIRQTELGQEMSEEEKYQRERKHRFGVNGTGGDLRAELDIRGENSLDQQKAQQEQQDEYSQKIMQPVLSGAESILYNYSKASDRGKAHKEILKYAKDMEFIQPQIDKMLEMANNHFDDLLAQEKESRIKEQEKAELANKKIKEATDKSAKEKEKVDPSTKGETVLKEIAQLESKFKLLDSQYNSNITKMNSKGADKKLLEQQNTKIESDKVWLQNQINAKKDQLSNFQSSVATGDESRMSTLSQAGIMPEITGQMQNNMKAIDDSREHVLWANKKYSSNQKKLQDELTKMNNAGVGYLYEIAKDPSGASAIVLKDDPNNNYTPYQKYLTDRIIPKPEDVTSRAKMAGGTAQTPTADTESKKWQDINDARKTIQAAKKYPNDPKWAAAADNARKLLQQHGVSE